MTLRMCKFVIAMACCLLMVADMQAQEGKEVSIAVNKAKHGSGLQTTLPPPAIAPFNAEQARKYQEQWAQHLGKPVVITNSIGMRLVLIPLLCGGTRLVDANIS